MAETPKDEAGRDVMRRRPQQPAHRPGQPGSLDEKSARSGNPGDGGAHVPSNAPGDVPGGRPRVPADRKTSTASRGPRG